MAARDSTVWAADPHTLAKHAILRGYLGAWYPIVSRFVGSRVPRNLEVLYVDGFAGPGVYERGEPGSPVIAIEQFLSHRGPLPVPVRVVLIEKDTERVERLRRELARLGPRVAANPSIRLDEPIEADASEAIRTILDEHERSNRYGAALFFLDQFGYSTVSMDQIQRILRFQSFEVFALVHYRDLDRFLTDTSKALARDRMFGGDEWNPAIRLGGADRRDYLLNTYKELLRSRGGAGFVCAFPRQGKSPAPLADLLLQQPEGVERDEESDEASRPRGSIPVR